METLRKTWLFTAVILRLLHEFVISKVHSNPLAMIGWSFYLSKKNKTKDQCHSQPICVSSAGDNMTNGMLMRSAVSVCAAVKMYEVDTEVPETTYPSESAVLIITPLRGQFPHLNKKMFTV